MKSKATYFLTIILITSIVFPFDISYEASAQVTEEWVALYSGPGNSGDWAYDLVIGPLGSIYITGRSRGNSSFNDYATIAYDPSGNQLWSSRYNGPGNGDDEATSMAIDSKGNIIVTGGSKGVGTENDYATIAYDTSGNELWVARYNGPQNRSDEARAITTDPFGNSYVTGESVVISNLGDIVTIAYDSSGNESWVARYNGPGNGLDRPNAITSDKNGNIYVTGSSWGNNNLSFVTIKYDKLGNEKWVRRYDGSEDADDHARAIDYDPISDRIYVTGWNNGDINRDFATIAYDTNGNQLWIRTFNGPADSHDYPDDIVVSSKGNIFVTGQSYRSGTNHDYATVAYDINGNQMWVSYYDGIYSDWDEGHAIAVDHSENVYVTGYERGGPSHLDITTVAYDSSGTQLWSVIYDGTANNFDRADSIAVDSIGKVYVAGVSGNRGTGSDYTLIKYSHNHTNLPPVANAGIDQIAYEGDLILFDGSASYHPDGTIKSYEWDFDSRDGLWWETGAPPDATGPSPTHIYGDDGIFVATLRITDNDNLTATDICKITVLNVDPKAEIESATMDLEIGLRVAGRKFNDVGLTIFEDGNSIGYVSIERLPGSPNKQMAWIPMTLDLNKTYSASVTYIPENPPNIGANPVWIYLKFPNGSIQKIHHTFNVQQSKERDSEHWNHIDPWEVDLMAHLIGWEFDVKYHVTDPGSDDEILTFSCGSQNVTVTHLRNPPNPDPYPSVEVDPVDILDIAQLVYEGAGTISLTVKDDDGGLSSASLSI